MEYSQYAESVERTQFFPAQPVAQELQEDAMVHSALKQDDLEVVQLVDDAESGLKGAMREGADAVAGRSDRIADRLTMILQRAESEAAATNKMADDRACQIISGSQSMAA